MAKPAVYTFSDTADRFFCLQTLFPSLFYKEAYCQKLNNFYNYVQSQKNRNGRHKNDVQHNNRLAGGKTSAKSLCTALGRSSDIEMTVGAFHFRLSLWEFRWCYFSEAKCNSQ